MVKYKIQKHKQLDCYILWKDVINEKNMACKCLYQGTKKECQEYLEKIKGE